MFESLGALINVITLGNIEAFANVACLLNAIESASYKEVPTRTILFIHCYKQYVQRFTCRGKH